MKDIVFSGWDPNVVLELWHVTKRFGGLTAVGDVSFKIKKGEIYALIGPNGAGKTTIFNLIAAVGNIDERDMFNTFNMGVGMTIVVSREDAPLALEVLKENGEDAYLIGEIVRGSEKIQII